MASATATRFGLSRGLLGLQYDQINESESESESFQFGSASWSFEMGFDDWLSAMSCVRMSGCQRCLVCGCLAVSDVLCADVWLSAMSCVRLVTAI